MTKFQNRKDDPICYLLTNNVNKLLIILTINTIQKNYATTDGAKDSQQTFKQYLERF